jgi:polysaccharide export outer membrane protein
MTERHAKVVRALWLGVVLALPVEASETNLIEILRKAQEALSQQTTSAAAASFPGTGTPEEAPDKHVLMSRDVVELKVVDEADLSLAKATVGSDGTIAHPLLGGLKVGGKTVEEAQTMIHDLLAKDYLVKPRVSLTVLERAERSFTVRGQVVRPGTYTWSGRENMTLSRAIALAGGLTRSAAPSRVIVRREVGGEAKMRRVDLEQAAKSRDAVPFLLQSGDVIEVEGKAP